MVSEKVLISPQHHVFCQWFRCLYCTEAPLLHRGPFRLGPVSSLWGAHWPLALSSSASVRPLGKEAVLVLFLFGVELISQTPPASLAP